MQNKKRFLLIIIVVFLLALIAYFLRISTQKNINDSLGASVINPLLTQEVSLLTKDLRFGSSDDEVKLLEDFLVQKGYFLGTPDVLYGNDTKDAVKKFQSDNGKIATGDIFQDTRDLINQVLSTQTDINQFENDPALDNLNIDAQNQDPTDVLNQDNSGDGNTYDQRHFITKRLQLFSFNREVGILQATLHERGFDVGIVDNIFGLKTFNAVKELQSQNGISVDGVVDGETKDLINLFIQENLDRQYSQNQEENLEEENKDTIEFVDMKYKDSLFKDYECKSTGSEQEKMFVFTGETMDETKSQRSVFSLSDVWSTADGVNWKKEANSTNLGNRWETMTVKVGDTIYSFGGKYESNSDKSDREIYKTTDGVNWTYVGLLPQMSHYYDRSVVYFKDKFWLISSQEGKNGVWSSSTGESWTQELSNTPWTGLGYDRKSNTWGYYDSNSLGAYVIGGKMWYIVSNSISNTNGVSLRIYSTSNGVNWTDEGLLVDSKTNQVINILTNINPNPLSFNGKIWIVSSDRYNSSPLVINTSNGKDWNIVSTKDTEYAKYTQIADTKVFNNRQYPSMTVFLGKLWSIGGWDLVVNNQLNDNTNDIWSSADGIKWQKNTPKGISSFPGPADRWLAGIATISPSFGKAVNLEIQKEYNATGLFTGQNESQRILGEWKFVGNEANTKDTGDIIISELSFVGSDYKKSDSTYMSSLQILKNINIYADGVLVGSLSNFQDPFYDSNNEYALSKTIKLNKNITIKKGQSVSITIKADFDAPTYQNFEMRTWLSGIGFAKNENTPCKVFSNDESDGKSKISGKLLYYKK